MKPSAVSCTASWDAGDPEVRQLWRRRANGAWKSCVISCACWISHIDVWFFESEVDEPSKQIVEELIRLGIADDERPAGPVIGTDRREVRAKEREISHQRDPAQ